VDGGPRPADVAKKTTDPQDEENDPSANSPDKKKKNGPAPALCAENRYSAQATAHFALASATHIYKHLRTYAEVAISLTSEDEPKELISAFELLLRNGRYLDPYFGLTPLKAAEGTKQKIITKEDIVPLNFTHLGLYMGTSGRQIFEPRKKRTDNNNSCPHRDEEEEERTRTKEVVVYFTFAFATDLDPRSLIDGIRNK
jgi:hypothetical protein